MFISRTIWTLWPMREYEEWTDVFFNRQPHLGNVFIISFFQVDYCASKHGAVGFHEAISEELRLIKADGVKVGDSNFLMKISKFSLADFPDLPLLHQYGHVRWSRDQVSRFHDWKFSFTVLYRERHCEILSSSSLYQLQIMVSSTPFVVECPLSPSHPRFIVRYRLHHGSCPHEQAGILHSQIPLPHHVHFRVCSWF